MQQKLLAEFPEVGFETWRERVDKDLKGADFNKKLVTRTIDGLELRPLFVEGDLSAEAMVASYAGLAPYRRGGAAVGLHGARWDSRGMHEAPDVEQLRADIASDLARGVTSLWLRFDANVRAGRDADATTLSEQQAGIGCVSAEQLAEVLRDVDLAKVPLMLDAGGGTTAVAAALFAVARKRGVAVSSLRGTLGADPLGTLASEGALPGSLESARDVLVELVRAVSADGGKLRAVNVSTSPYHNAGASSVQEVAYALATGVEYLRWLTAAGIEINAAASAIAFSCSIGNDLFTEVAKLRALRSCWAKIVAASGGNAEAQNTLIHATTSQRTKTVRDPWVNMLRTTTESFSAMVGGADSLTTLGFDEVIGPSDSFSRRIARNVQVVLNEEAHVTHVADPAGGSYFVEALTDQLANEAWKAFQSIDAQGGMAKALQAGTVAKDIAEIADKRAASIRKRGSALLGVSEFANLGEERIERPAPRAAKVNAANLERLKKQRAASPQDAAVAEVAAARASKKPVFAAAVAAAQGGASIGALTAALFGSANAARIDALPVRRHADVFEALRTRSETTAARPTVFLANLGAIPQHKARSTFSTGFMNAGGIAVLDNEGFATAEDVVAAFAQSGAKVAVICGSDDQYPEWIPKVAPLLRSAGAVEVLLAGRPGDHEAAFKQAGVGGFLFMGSDVVATLSSLLDRMGVAS